ncbi:MAG TPA: hypothetical protein VGD48_04580 [Kutzneria sp.]|jgi:hypothetical protein
MSYLRGFVPWIAFAVLSSLGWQWGALAGLVLAVALFVDGRRKGTPLDTQVLEISTMAYFAVLTVFALLVPASPVQHFVGAISMAWLALTAWGGLVVRQPFTLGIAKQQTPKELWGHPVFRRINVVITTVWAIAFTLTAAVLTALDLADAGTVASILAQVAGFAIPAIFTVRYPERVRSRQDA